MFSAEQVFAIIILLIGWLSFFRQCAGHSRCRCRGRGLISVSFSGDTGTGFSFNGRKKVCSGYRGFFPGRKPPGRWSLFYNKKIRG